MIRCTVPYFLTSDRFLAHSTSVFIFSFEQILRVLSFESNFHAHKAMGQHSRF